MEEIWKPVVGYEGLYEVSNLGRVKSVDRYVNHSTKGKVSLRKGKILKQHLRAGYPFVVLSSKGVHKNFSTHRLVAIAFPEICGKQVEGTEVNHKNENKLDSRAENLEWIPRADNNNYGTRNKRTSEKLKNSKLSKPISQYDLNGTLIETFPSSMEIRRKFGFTRSVIFSCCKNGWTGYGYKWRYA